MPDNNSYQKDLVHGQLLRQHNLFGTVKKKIAFLVNWSILVCTPGDKQIFNICDSIQSTKYRKHKKADMKPTP